MSNDIYLDVEYNVILRGDAIDALKRVYDMERLSGRIAYGNANRT